MSEQRLKPIYQMPRILNGNYQILRYLTDMQLRSPTLDLINSR